jgi:hypothetical protein
MRESHPALLTDRNHKNTFVSWIDPIRMQLLEKVSCHQMAERDGNRFAFDAVRRDALLRPPQVVRISVFDLAVAGLSITRAAADSFEFVRNQDQGSMVISDESDLVTAGGWHMGLSGAAAHGAMARNKKVSRS